MIGGTSKRRLRVAALGACVVAITLPLSACGGDDEEPATTAAEETTSAEEQEAAVEQTLIDFGNAEGTASCNYLSDSYIDELGGPSGCNEEFGDAVAADYKVSNISISGTTATADVATDGQRIKFDLVNENGEWLISDLRSG